MTILDNGTPQRLRIVDRTALIPGYIHGLRQPSLQILIEIMPGEIELDSIVASIEGILTIALPNLEPGELEGERAIDVGRYLASAMYRIQRALHLPVSGPGQVFELRETGHARQVATYLPVMVPGRAPLERLYAWLLDSLNAAIVGQPVVGQGLPALFDAIVAAFPGDSAANHFLDAAIDLNIPFNWVTADIIQYGQGRKSRLMTGTFTDATSRFGTVTARHKVLAAELMRQHGIPVPQHIIVSSPDQGVAAAQALGWPVVVKPADQDGGSGVAAGLTTPDEVRAAVVSALALSPNVLVERFVAGRDYRMIVFQGQLIAITERTPGGVTGDGRRTIRALLDEYNQHPMRGNQRHQPLKPLTVDEEAVALLRAEGLGLGSVPDAGRFVRMRSAANVVRGGSTRDVTELAHPDNRLLAERAARALNLDLAGIDFLTDDISHSWRDRGGAICEINAQPQLGYVTTARLYPQILQTMLPRQGRIPVVIVYGAEKPVEFMGELARGLAVAGLPIGSASQHGVWIGDHCIAEKPRNLFEAGQILLRDRQVGAMLLAINDFSVLEAGLPVDVCDLLVVAGDNVKSNDVWAEVQPRALLQAILPACSGEVIVSSANCEASQDARQMLPARRLTAVSPDQLYAAAISRFGVSRH